MSYVRITFHDSNLHDKLLYRNPRSQNAAAGVAGNTALVRTPPCASVWKWLPMLPTARWSGKDPSKKFTQLLLAQPFIPQTLMLTSSSVRLAKVRRMWKPRWTISVQPWPASVSHTLRTSSRAITSSSNWPQEHTVCRHIRSQWHMLQWHIRSQWPIMLQRHIRSPWPIMLQWHVRSQWHPMLQ